MAITKAELSDIEHRVRTRYKAVVVDAFLVDAGNSKILMQKRSAGRRLFPNMWDPVGGHLENHETVSECLEREIREETSMRLTEVVALVNEFEWPDNSSVVNLQFLCRAVGAPVPEAGKVTEIRWIATDDLTDIEDFLTSPILDGVNKAFLALKKLG